VANDEGTQGKAQSPEGLARDIARLYSYAHVDEGSYRVFTRHPKPQFIQQPVTEIPEPATAQPASTPVSAQAVASPAPAEPAPSAPPETAVPSISVTRPPAPSPSAPQAAQKTAIAITSIAGGVGKTTLAANLGRILSSHGENVLLVDISGNALLPFYFGASDLRPGMRTFVSPEPGALPIHVLCAETVTCEWLESEVRPAMRTVQRTIFDIGPASFTLRPEIFSLCAVRLIPLVVDLNSILSIPRIEASTAVMCEQQKLDLPHPTYVLNKYDEESEREREGRDLITRQVGDHLLPITIRRSPYVTEAISQRMTVVDYAFDSKITEDLYQLALWLKQAAPIAQPAAKHSAVRWSEA
jgi:cellulose biosynthesis protein BcsQ